MTEPSEPPSRTASPTQMDLLTADELARLRELASTPKKPWRSDYALWIAGFGFALSLATGIISAVIGYQKDIHDQQAQLAAALHSIQELTIRQAEIYEKIQGKEGTLLENTAAKMITAELNTDLRTATALALNLRSNATTAELATLGEGQYGIGDVATSRQLLQDALSAAQNANDESTALRYLGYLEIRSGVTPQTRAEGEELFSRAMSLDKKYNLQYSSYQANFLRATAAFDWANAIAPFDCDAAQKHFDDGVKNLIANPRTPEMVQMRRLALPVYRDGFNGAPACKPSPQTVLAP